MSGVGVEEVRGWAGVEAVVEEVGGADRVGGSDGADGVGGARGTTGSGGAVGAAAGAAAGGGVGADRERRRLEISVVEAEPVVRRLLENDPELTELEVARAGLAEAFVRITRGPMRASDGLAREGQPWSYNERAVSAQGKVA